MQCAADADAGAGLGGEPVSAAAGRTGHQVRLKQRCADFRGLHAVPADGVGVDAAESGAVLAVFRRRGGAAVRAGRRCAVAGKHVSPFAHEVDAPGHGQHCRRRDAQRRANRDGDDYPPHVAIGVLHGCPDAQRHSLRRADRRERHAGDEAHEAYQVGEIAKGGKGRPQTSSVFMPPCRLRRGEALCTTKIN